MLNINNINSLTDFTRNAREHIDRLKETGKPEVLTVNGRAEVVVQDAEAYQKVLDALEESKSVESIRRALESMARGEGRPMREFIQKFAAENGVTLE